MKEYENNKEKFDCFDFSNYEKSHGTRIEHLVDDLKLRDIKNSNIVDFGCSGGFLIKKLMTENKNNAFFGLDYYDYNHEEFNYLNVDFDFPFSDEFFNKYNIQADIGFCFEVCEHIPNLYNFISEMKKIVKPEGKIYLSIPHVSVTHNTLYPGLFYPVDNFREFLLQMALEIEDVRIHNKQFAQHVFSLKNKDWSHSKMKWYKNEEKFRNISPLVAVSL